MPFFIQKRSRRATAAIEGVWEIDEGGARLVRSGGHIAVDGRVVPRPPLRVAETLRRTFPTFFAIDPNFPQQLPFDAVFHELRLNPGHQWVQIARPTVRYQVSGGYGGRLEIGPLNYAAAGGDSEPIAIGAAQLVALKRELEEICRTAHPSAANLHVYGHRTRNLLILACTEAEAHWRSVLKANGARKKLYNVTGYSKLESVMCLGDYKVYFSSYPWLMPFEPFIGWEPDNPDERSLSWYQAYNDVKHDRGGKFPNATLQHALSAVAACVIMMVAQYGKARVFQAQPELQSFFEVGEPKFPVSETYIEDYGPDRVWADWKTIPHPALADA